MRWIVLAELATGHRWTRAAARRGACATWATARGVPEAVAPVDAGADAADVASLLDRPVERLSQQHV